MACTGRLSNANWPGISTDGTNVYVAYGNGVLAYDVAEQQEQWVFSPEPNRLLFYAAPSVQDGRIVVGDFGASGSLISPGVVTTVYGLADNGNRTPDELWANNDLTSDRFVAPALQVGDQIFAGTADNLILAIDANSGELMWQFETGNSVWGQPTYKDETLFVGSLDRNVYALDAASGSERWRTTLTGAIAAQPLVNGDLLYVTSFDRQLHALSLDSGEEQWAVEASDWIWGAAVMDDASVYFADASGNVYAVDAVKGTQTWTQQVDGTVQTTPALADGILYIVSGKVVNGEDPTGLLTALSVDGGTQLWQQETTTPIYTTPVVVEGMLVVAVQTEEDILIAFDASTGTRQWDVAPPAPPES